MDRITIIGTGLIGTSLGMAIKRAARKGTEVVGTDIDRGRAVKAQRMGALDHVSSSLAGAVEGSSVVIIATPLMAARQVMEIVAPRLEQECVVTDTASAKGAILEWARELLPRHVSFVGGHPLVSKEGMGPEAADPSLFNGRPYCIIPAQGASQHAVDLLSSMVSSMGAKPYFIDVAEHDSFVAAVTHLPMLFSLALANCTSRSPSWGDISQLASTHYGDMTKFASNDPQATRDVLATNGESIVHWIDAFIHELYDIRSILVSDEPGRMKALEKICNSALLARNKWLTGAVAPGSQQSIVRETLSSGVTQFMTGNAQARRRLFGWGSRRDKDSDLES